MTTNDASEAWNAQKARCTRLYRKFATTDKACIYDEGFIILVEATDSTPIYKKVEYQQQDGHANAD